MTSVFIVLAGGSVVEEEWKHVRREAAYRDKQNTLSRECVRLHLRSTRCHPGNELLQPRGVPPCARPAATINISLLPGTPRLQPLSSTLVPCAQSHFPFHDQVPTLVAPHVPWKKTCGLSEPHRSPPQVHAISKGSLFHVARIVRGPSRVGPRSEPGLSWEYLSPCIDSIRPPSSYVPLSAQDFSF